jgi:UDP-N-acetylmuramoyl-L-alanyl-D-glutamate--2,6-diaminopimelate ligase
VRLADLIEGLPPACGDVWIDRVVADSRAAGAGALFVARRGSTVDGHSFIADAARAGCSAIVGSDRLPMKVTTLLHKRGVAYVQVDDSAEMLGRLAARVNGRPSSALTIVGVTGTNGKTTVSTLLYQLFTALGHRCGLIATTGIRVGREQLPNAYTTPDAVELQRVLARMVSAGCRYCFMEVTSHAIHQRRIAGIDFAGGIFTTLGRDHLDYHGTLEAYATVKQRFFAQLPPSAFALANADDPSAAFMVATTRARVAFYGSRADALLPWSVERRDERGMDVHIGLHHMRTRLVGEHNAGNLAACVSAATLLGEELASVVAVVPHLRGARGRMQLVVAEPVLAIVDYAHTPEAVWLALAAARSLRPSAKLIAVGGCGGDRDSGKRPAIGAALATADAAIFTADNPRSEDPLAIVRAMLAGIPASCRATVQIELDRSRAIGLAVSIAQPGDIILVVGKGHERAQEISGTRHRWDDAAEVRAALEAARQPVEAPPQYV